MSSDCLLLQGTSTGMNAATLIEYLHFIQVVLLLILYLLFSVFRDVVAIYGTPGLPWSTGWKWLVEEPDRPRLKNLWAISEVDQSV